MYTPPGLVITDDTLDISLNGSRTKETRYRDTLTTSVDEVTDGGLFPMDGRPV